ncbi:MAG: MogA/MoaB family molybdenum cofactor biosynthesis protein [Archaeoglobaceae archaeon]
MKHHEVDIEIKVGIVTISTSKWKNYGNIRGIEALEGVEGMEGMEGVEDSSGKIIKDKLSPRYNVMDYRLIPDDTVRIYRQVTGSMQHVDAVVTTGGTGITPSDLTIEAIEPILTKKLDGFGEIFRLKSYDQVGSSAILSRALAGLLGDKAIFCLPGSPKAAELGAEMVEGVLQHVVSHAKGLK